MMRRFIRTITDLWAALAGRAALRPLNVFLATLGLKGLGILNYRDLRQSGEEHLWTRLGPLLPSEAIIFDVGGNLGGYTEMVLRHVPLARVTTFEPNSRCVAHLQSSLGARVRIEEVAVGRSSGRSRLFLPVGDGLSQLASLRQEAEAGEGQDKCEEIDVRVVTLDDYCEEVRIHKVDFLKIDVEGAETDVLDGSQKLLMVGQVDLIQFEFNKVNYTIGQTLADFHRRLPGYKFFRILPHGLLPLEVLEPYLFNVYAFQNILAVAPRVFASTNAISSFVKVMSR